MELTQYQIGLIQQSFRLVEPIADTAADIFYKKLFNYDPSLKKLFKNDIKSQGRKLMSTLKLAVNGLNNLDTLVPVLENMAIKHKGYGVEADDYTPVGNALIHTLKAGLGDQLSRETEDAWVQLYKIIAHVMRAAAYPGYNQNTYRNNKHYYDTAS